MEKTNNSLPINDKMIEFKKLLIDTYKKYRSDYTLLKNSTEFESPLTKIRLKYDEIEVLINKYLKNGFFGKKYFTGDDNMTEEKKLEIMENTENIVNVKSDEFEKIDSDVDLDIEHIKNIKNSIIEIVDKNFPEKKDKFSLISQENNITHSSGGKKRRTMKIIHKRKAKRTLAKKAGKKCAKKCAKRTAKKMRS